MFLPRFCKAALASTVVLLACLGSATTASAEDRVPTQHDRPGYCGYGNRAKCATYDRYDRAFTSVEANPRTASDRMSAGYYAVLLPLEGTIKATFGNDLTAAKIIRVRSTSEDRSCRAEIYRQMLWIVQDTYDRDRSVYDNERWATVVLSQAKPGVSLLARRAGNLVAEETGNRSSGTFVERAVGQGSDMTDRYRAALAAAVKVGDYEKTRSIVINRVGSMRTFCPVDL